MIKLNDENFELSVKENKQFLAMFYMESGCSHCEKLKPVFEEFSKNTDIVCGMYPLIRGSSKIADSLKVRNAPTIVAYVDGQIVNMQSGGDVDLSQMFNPPALPIDKAPLLQLLTDEAQLIDQIYPLKKHLEELRLEIARRRNV